MRIADIVFLGLVALLLLIGARKGFGQILVRTVSGFFGRITAIVLTYFLYGVVLNWSIVNNLISLLVDKLTANGNWVCKLLLAVRVDMIVLAVALFVAVFCLLRIVAGLSAKILETRFFLMTIPNRIGGAALMLCYACIGGLVFFQLSAWIFGTSGGLYPFLQGSLLRLDDIYVHNPLNSIFQTIRHSLAGFF